MNMNRSCQNNIQNRSIKLAGHMNCSSMLKADKIEVSVIYVSPKDKKFMQEYGAICLLQVFFTLRFAYTFTFRFINLSLRPLIWKKL